MTLKFRVESFNCNLYICNREQLIFLVWCVWRIRQTQNHSISFGGLLTLPKSWSLLMYLRYMHFGQENNCSEYQTKKNCFIVINSYYSALKTNIGLIFFPKNLNRIMVCGIKTSSKSVNLLKCEKEPGTWGFSGQVQVLPWYVTLSKSFSLCLVSVPVCVPSAL